MKRFLAVIVSAGVLCVLQSGASAASLEQRAAFREVWPAAERGDWAPVAEKERLLRDYVLWPDLRAAWLRARVAGNGPDAVYPEIAAFLARHETLKPARELRYRLALSLAANDRLSEYLDLYERHYRTLGVAKLDCLAAQAEILTGQPEDVVDRAVALWLIGGSQVDECDPVFDYLRGAGLLGEKLYRERYDLAVSARDFSLARYLARSLDGESLDEASRWIAARDRPEEFLTAGSERRDSNVHRQQLLYALERIAYRDAGVALELWQDVRESFAFARDDAVHITQHIALWTARQHRPGASAMLRDLPEEARNTEVQRWLVRTALARHAWQDVIDTIGQMPGDEGKAEEWQYWLAIAHRESGNEATAGGLLRELAASRSYYGFLAADELDDEYAWSHAAMEHDEQAIRKLERDDRLVRARELFLVGQGSRGRSEWNAAIDTLDTDQQMQAAILAHRWDWHSQAIATAAALGLYDDLEIRYPLAFRDHFEEHAAAAGISHSWAYGIARSESLFMADVRSGAGAIGLMQLMPATGQRSAAELEHPYDGLDTLTDPHSNIRLGTHYLAKMLQRFGDSRVLATAAYNAGPHRVEQWLPQGDRLDARIWIENIPYNETRGFVRRVLFSDAIFHWRLTGETRRLSAALTAIDSAGRPRQVANAGPLRRR